MHRLHVRVTYFALSLVLTLAATPLGTVRAQNEERCFPETGFCIEGRIREFWEQNGGLRVFGLPIGAEQEMQIEGRPLEAQWFERNRIELHPENQPPYDVLLGRLGSDRLHQNTTDRSAFPQSAPQAGCRFFPETGHSICGDILKAWRANGLEFDERRGTSEAESLALFGLPLSDIQMELVEGQEYAVQWFERARFEIHPERGPEYRVLLGRLGAELYRPFAIEACDNFSGVQIDANKWQPPTNPNLIYVENGVLNLRITADQARGDTSAELEAILEDRSVREVSFVLTLLSFQEGIGGGTGIEITQASGRELSVFAGAGGSETTGLEVSFCKTSVCGGQPGEYDTADAGRIQNGESKYIRIVWSGQAIDFYIDGVRIATGPADPTPIAAVRIAIWADAGSVYHVTTDDMCIHLT